MSLTEEQREALISAIDSLSADACDAIRDTKHGEYIQAENQNEIEILRAMIDSSEHVTEPTKMIGFDLEKARATNELQKITIVLAEKNVFIKKQGAEIKRLRLELTQALKDLSSKDEIIEKLKKGFLKSAYERNKVRHGHAWYPDDETYQEYLDGIDADARKNAQESLDDVLRGDVP